MNTNDAKQVAVNLKIDVKSHEKLRKLAIATGLTNEAVVSELLGHIDHDTALEMLNDKMLEKKRILAERVREQQERKESTKQKRAGPKKRLRSFKESPQRDLSVERVRQLLNEINRGIGGSSGGEDGKN